jgi:hypothetical protein
MLTNYQSIQHYIVTLTDNHMFFIVRLYNVSVLSLEIQLSEGGGGGGG